MKIQDVMSTCVRTCRVTDSLNLAAQLMWDAHVGSVPVLNDESRLVGMLTDRDIAMAAYTQGRRLDEIQVTTAMAKQVYSVPPKADLEQAERLMREHRVRRLPVVEGDGQVVGMLSLDDLALAASRQAERRNPELKAVDLVHTFAEVCIPSPAAAAARQS